MPEINRSLLLPFLHYPSCNHIVHSLILFKNLFPYINHYLCSNLQKNREDNNNYIYDQNNATFMKPILLLLIFSFCFLTAPRLTAESKPAIVHTKHQSETVYVTRTGLKYHRGNCRFLRKSRIPLSKKNAIGKGYGACSICHP